MVHYFLNCRGFLFSSCSSTTLSTSLEEAFGFLTFTFDLRILGDGLLSGNIFNTIPMDISNSPDPWRSINGFVNIM